LALVVEVAEAPMSQEMGIEMESHPYKLVAIQNMEVVGHLPLKMTLLRVYHQHMAQEGMVAGIVTGTEVK